MAQTGYTPILLYSSTTAAQAPAAGNLTNSTFGSELAINITDGKLFYKDNANAVQVIAWKTTPTTAGGTGLTSYTAGDLPYYATGTTLSKLAIGSNGQVLTSTGTAPQWTTLSGVAVTTFSAGTTGFTPSVATSGAITLAGTLITSNGGTGLSSYTQGDLLYYNTGTTLTALAKNTSATRYLSNTGSNNNPAWAQVDLTNGVTGTLPVGNGGTGLSSLTSNQVLYGAFNQSSNLYFDGNDLGIGTSTPAVNSVTVVKSIGQGVITLLSSTTPTGSQRLFFIGAGSVTDTNKARVTFDTPGAWTNGVSTPTRIYFSTTPSGSTTPANRMLINSDGNVGVNTSTPAAKFTVIGGNAGNLLVDNDGSQYTQLLLQTNSTANTGADILIDGTNKIAYLRTLLDAPWVFSTSASAGSPTEKMRLTTGGFLGIGTTSPAALLDTQQSTTDMIGVSILNTNNSVGTTTSAQLRLGITNSVGASYAVIKAQEGGADDYPALTFAVQNSATTTPAERMRIFSSGGVSIGNTTDPGATNLSVSGNVVIATSGKGIDFSATSGTGTSELLDDYEEGTWTPVLTFATAGNLSVAYSTQTGLYVKVGRLVTATCSVSTSTFTHTTASGDLRITGIPFTAATAHYSNLGFNGINKTNYTTVMPRTAASSGVVTFLASGMNQGASTVKAADMPTAGSVELNFTICYETDS